MTINTTFLQVAFLAVCHTNFAQLPDSVRTQRIEPPEKRSDYFRVLTGGLNTLFSGEQARGSMDIGVQSCHYYLITGRRFKNDSLHRTMTSRKEPISKVYKGFHFYLLNRAAVNLDSIKSMASEYLASLKASPLTVRLRKEIFLSKQRMINPANYAPVISLMLTGDGRAIPFLDRTSKVQLGVSSHLYLTFSSLFKRLEFDVNGNMIDQGTIYLKPSIGIGYGSKELMKNVSPKGFKKPLLSTDWRLGFKSEKFNVKDFSLMMSYSISEMIGPRLRAGILLSAIQ